MSDTAQNCPTCADNARPAESIASSHQGLIADLRPDGMAPDALTPAVMEKLRASVATSAARRAGSQVGPQDRAPVIQAATQRPSPTEMPRTPETQWPQAQPSWPAIPAHDLEMPTPPYAMPRPGARLPLGEPMFFSTLGRPTMPLGKPYFLRNGDLVLSPGAGPAPGPGVPGKRPGPFQGTPIPDNIPWRGPDGQPIPSEPARPMKVGRHPIEDRNEVIPEGMKDSGGRLGASMIPCDEQYYATHETASEYGLEIYSGGCPYKSREEAESKAYDCVLAAIDAAYKHYGAKGSTDSVGLETGLLRAMRQYRTIGVPEAELARLEREMMGQAALMCAEDCPLDSMKIVAYESEASLIRRPPPPEKTSSRIIEVPLAGGGKAFIVFVMVSVRISVKWIFGVTVLCSSEQSY